MSGPNPTRVAIYVRVSTLDQEPENQLAEVRRYVGARGWASTEYVDRGVSGAKDRRPALDALLKDGRYEVMVGGGRVAAGVTPDEWAVEVQRRGAGEILLQAIHRDGTAKGYDTDLIRLVASAVTIPVIACSGIGRFEEYAAGIRAGASAVAAANIWHFKELADRAGKRALAKAGVEIRL